MLNMDTDIIKQTHALLIKNKKTVAIAESCTGGMASCLLTSQPGSSRYFILGLVAYSNEAKKNILGVTGAVITRKGAVSAETAAIMAKRIKSIAKTDFGLGITGIAGPTGGSKEKPVGTVFIAVASKNKKICRKFIFYGSRLDIQRQAALQAIKLLS